MSVTTTTNPQTYALHAVLADYDIHHTPSDTLDPTLNPHPTPSSTSTSSPSNWPTTHHRIPPHRPVNTHLVQSERRVYRNGVERAFVGVMFTGVVIEATISKVWRATLGRVWEVGYKVGGEW